jgi:hypothetical protein
MRQSWKTRLTRVEQMEAAQPRTVVLRVAWDASDGSPVTWGEEYAYILPEKAPNAEVWSQHVRRQFAYQLPPERRSHGALPDVDPIAGG